MKWVWHGKCLRESGWLHASVRTRTVDFIATRRHEDGPQATATGLGDRVAGRESVARAQLPGLVHQQDGVVDDQAQQNDEGR